MLYFKEASDDVTMSCYEMVILSAILINTDLHNNLDEDDLETIILIRLLVWLIKFKKQKST